MLFSFQFQSSVLNFYFPNEFPEQVTKNETLFQDLVGTFTLLSCAYFVLNHPLNNAVMQIQCYALRALKYYSTKT